MNQRTKDKILKQLILLGIEKGLAVDKRDVKGFVKLIKELGVWEKLLDKKLAEKLFGTVKVCGFGHPLGQIVGICGKELVFDCPKCKDSPFEKECMPTWAYHLLSLVVLDIDTRWEYLNEYIKRELKK